MMKSNDSFLTRSLTNEIKSLAFRHGKMAFISGPRQVGKTFLSRSYKSKYYNWDLINFRKVWATDPLSLLSKDKVLVFDEVHKAKNWKTTLKAIYDYKNRTQNIIVTGSARLETFKRGGDSLLGRYFNFHLHPFTVGELLHKSIPSPDDFLQNLKQIDKKVDSDSENTLERLSQFSGFPEPYLKHDVRFYELWSSGRLEKLVREDLRDLSRVLELGQIEVLCSLLPDKVGSPISIKNLAQDIEASPITVKKWISYLNSLFFLFEVKPFSLKNPRAIKKEGKIYLWDYAAIVNEGARLENIVASHLYKACEYWRDLGYGQFALSLYRDKEKREVDFVITKKNIPWAVFEVKTNDSNFSSHIDYFMKRWPSVNAGIVLTISRGVFREVEEKKYVCSLSRILSLLP